MTRRLAVYIALIIVTSTAAGCLVTGVIVYKLATGEAAKVSVSRERQIQSCTRGSNLVVQVLRLENDLVAINQGRVDALRELHVGADDPTLKAQRYARRQYTKDRIAFVMSLVDFAINPGAITPNGVRTNCALLFG
jgi:hypothetical protein